MGRTEILFEPFPEQMKFLDAVVSKKFSTIIYGGSIRSGKTFAGLGALIILCKIYPGSRWIVVRKDLQTVKRNTLPSWEKIKPHKYVESFDWSTMTASMTNGSKIMFFGENYDKDKDFNRWRGLECNGFLLEEINELQEGSYFKAIERAGSYIITELEVQPPPLIMGTVNPTWNWVKERFYDPFKNGTLPENVKFILANIEDNHFIPAIYKESLKSLPKFEYAVFVEGNWDIQLKTGGEFYSGSDLEKHIKPSPYDENTTIHITFDNNVAPYIAIAFWQLSNEGKTARQIHEIPATDPDNSASKSAKLAVKYLQSIGYENSLYLYGDQTSGSRNTIDNDKKSFIDLFYNVLKGSFSVTKRIPSKNPPVAMSGDFINAVYSDNYLGLDIEINDVCKVSINDYINTKKNKDGGILKKTAIDPTRS